MSGLKGRFSGKTFAPPLIRFGVFRGFRSSWAGSSRHLWEMTSVLCQNTSKLDEFGQIRLRESSFWHQRGTKTENLILRAVPPIVFSA
jgi:hypothetical protein